MADSQLFNKIRLHPKQSNAFYSDKKVTLCCSGIQGGKSTVGAIWFITQAAKYRGSGHNLIIGAPTYKILNQSTLPTFMKFASTYGTYNKVDQEFNFFSGPKAYFRTSTEPYSVEGITDVRAIWLDEAGMTKYLFWVNLEGRAARTNAPLFLTTTPYGLNWPYQNLIKPFREGRREDVGYHEWLSIDNPSFPVEEYERQKRILDPRTFRRKYMGIHERMEGLVYELSDDNFCEPFALPKNCRVFAAVDWGFSDGHEFAIIVRAISLDGFRYTVDEFKGAGLDPQQQIQMCKSKSSIWKIERFYCDPARPDMISALNKAGESAVGFHVGADGFKQLIPGINKHYELIKSGKYKIWRSKCPYLMDEYETYHWPEHQDEKQPKEVPVKINDHLLDCERMLTVGTMNVFVKEPPLSVVSQRFPERDFWNPAKNKKTPKSWESY